LMIQMLKVLFFTDPWDSVHSSPFCFSPVQTERILLCPLGHWYCALSCPFNCGTQEAVLFLFFSYFPFYNLDVFADDLFFSCFSIICNILWWQQVLYLSNIWFT
jgi:hypothetical protein